MQSSLLTDHSFRNWSSRKCCINITYVQNVSTNMFFVSSKKHLQQIYPLWNLLNADGFYCSHNLLQQSYQRNLQNPDGFYYSHKLLCCIDIFCKIKVWQCLLKLQMLYLDLSYSLIFSTLFHQLSQVHPQIHPHFAWKRISSALDHLIYPADAAFMQ